MFYCFDTDVAKEYGVNEAIMIANLQQWIVKNKANNEHFHDGHYWTYNSKKGFTELFPFWSEQNIKTILKHLKEHNVIIAGNYNENTYDRTLWYAFVDEEKWLGENQPMHRLESTNASVRTNQWIPDNINNNNINNNIYNNPNTPSNNNNIITNPPLSQKDTDSKADAFAVETTASIVNSDSNEILTAVNGFRDAWNKKICTDHNWGSRIVLLNESRKKSLKVRLKEILPMRNNFCPEKPLLDFFFDNVLLVRISKSSFLQGMVEPSPNHPNRFKLSIDNIISPSFFAKLIDGTYDNDKNRF